MTDRESITVEILRNLYLSYFREDGKVNLHEVRQSGKWNEDDFWKVVDRLTHNGYIKARTLGGFYTITAKGIIRTEERGIVPDDLVAANQRARTLIMDTLAKVYEEGGSLSDSHYERICQETGLTTDEFIRNAIVLKELGYVESSSVGCFKVTYYGLNAVGERRQQKAIAIEFDDVLNLKPHPRGRAFQKLFAKILRANGWEPEEGVTTEHEEMDVIFCREREFFLVECRWEKDPIQAGAIRELYGKLSNRIDVKGMFVSMSGFSSGAVIQAEDYASSKVVLLFGPKDVSSLIYDRVPFDELLNQKYRLLISRRKIVYD